MILNTHVSKSYHVNTAWFNIRFIMHYFFKLLPVVAVNVGVVVDVILGVVGVVLVLVDGVVPIKEKSSELKKLAVSRNRLKII